MYSWWNGLSEIGYLAIQGFCVQYFFGSFLKRRKIGGRFHGGCVGVCFAVSLWCADFWMEEMPGVRRTLQGILLKAFLLTALAFVFYQAGTVRTCFVVVAFLAVGEICFLISYTCLHLSTKLFDLVVWGWDRGIIPSVERMTTLLEIASSILTTFHFLMCGVLLYLSLRRLVRCFSERDYRILGEDLPFLLAPGVTGICIGTLLKMLLITVEGDTPTLLYERYPFLQILVLLIAVSSLLTILFAVSLFQDLIRSSRERSERVILERQVEQLQGHIAELERVYSGVRSIKHDMKNTIAVLTQLAASGGDRQIGEMQDCLAELNQCFAPLESRFQTGSTAADALLDLKYHEALLRLPELALDADGLLFPEGLKIHGYDIAVILGNALDNAIEACARLKGKEKEKEGRAELFIRLSSYFRGKLIFIRVENSFDGKLDLREGAEFPQTGKAEKRLHGIGLTNIRYTAEKYHGAVDWQADGGVFTLSVMMKADGRGQGD